MHSIKKNAKRWLSGLLAVVMMAGLVPSTGLITPASAAGAPGTIECVKTVLSKTDVSTVDPITNKVIMDIPGHQTVRSRYFEFKQEDGTVTPGMCADHKLGFPKSVQEGSGYKWNNPTEVGAYTIPTGTMKKIAPIVANFYVNYYQALWIHDQCAGTSLIGNPEELTAWLQENAKPQWPDLNWNAASYWGVPGSDDFMKVYWNQSAAAQAAVWLAAAGQLSPGDDLTDEDLRKIYTVGILCTHAEIGAGMGWASPYDDVPAFEADLNVKVGYGHVAIERYKKCKHQYDGLTTGMELYVYASPNAKNQPILVPTFTEAVANKAWLGVKKVDENGNGLPGAVFGVYESQGAASAGAPPLYTLTTDATGKAVTQVEWQGTSDIKTFYVKELTPPSGYKQDNSIVPVQVSKSANATEATAAMARGMAGWVNKEFKPSESEIKKIDESGNGIGKAKFNIKSLEAGFDKDIETDEDGNIPMQWTDPTAPNYYPPGEYTVTEIQPPPGYEKAKDPKEHTQALRLWVVEENGVKVGKSTGPIKFVNYEKHRIIIEKVGPNGGLAGAVFEVWYNHQKIDEIETGADGTFTYEGKDGKGLSTGFYSFKEKTPPPGYLLPSVDKREQCVYVDAEEGTVKKHTLVFENYQYPEIKIHKTKAGTGLGLAGATFEIKVNGQKVAGEFITSEGGWISIPWSIYGKYVGDGESNDTFTVEVRETVAPAGYLIDDDSWHSISFTKGQTAGTFEFEDTAYPDIIILKVDADDPTKVLPGATFEVKIEGQETFSVGPTGPDGKIVIPYEKYGEFLKDETRDQWEVSIREVSPPKGYLISDKSWHTQTLKRGEKKIEFVFKDAEYPKILIAKKDKETGEYLPNATFDISIDGTAFQTQKTTNEDGIIEITYDEYGEFLPTIDESGEGWSITVTEVKPPKYYNKDKQESSGDYTQTQKLLFNQKVTEFIFEDTSFRKIKVAKIDGHTGWPLKGATFHLWSVKTDDAAADSYDEYKTTDESGYVLFENIPNGTYNLQETQPPYGYDPDVYWSDGEPPIRTIIVTSDDPVIREFTAKNDPLTGIRIKKVDAVTDQPVAGALFKIEPLPPLQGSTIEEKTDGNGLIVLQDLPAGSYRITEISVPKPYILNSTPQIVSIDDQHDDFTVTFANNAEGILYILKRDAETDEPLAGAWFNVHKADGTFVGDVGPTGPNGYASLAGLQPGNYVVKEVKAPDGHVIDGESKTFEVKETDSGKVYILIFDNHSKPEMWLQKVDANTGVGLEGAVFRIEKGNGEIVKQNAISDHEGFIKIPNLEPGTYFAIETKAPQGYILDETPHQVTLEYGKTEIIKIKNQEPGGIAIRKVDAATGQPLSGVKFQLYSIDDTPLGLPKTTGNDGYVRWNNLDPGYYTVREVETREGYVLDKNPVKLEVEDFKTVEYVWKNTQTTTITIIKRDSDTLVPLAGATFGVYNLQGKLVDTLVTDINGVATSKQLELGHYKVVETKAPIGYVLNTEEHLVEVKADVPASIEVPNRPDKGLIIHKYDAITKDVLPGAWFELQKLDGTVVLSEFSTDASGTVTTSAVEPGEYYLVETKAPTGYVLNPEKILVKVLEGEATVVNVDNIPESIIEVFKTDSVTGNPIGGVEFEVADSEGKVLEYITTDLNGRAYSQVLKPGEYLVKETKPAAGYVKDETVHRVTIKEGQNALLQVKNVPDTVLHITKIGASSSAPVAGAVFELYETCGVEPCIKVGQYTTDEYGHAATEPLAPGIYKLKEIIAPAGYVLDETEYEVAVKAGEYNNIIIKNQEAATLTVRKIDSRTGKPIAGAVFKLETASGGLIGMLESDANGEAIFTGLKAGHYLVTETQAPPGYSLSSPDTQNITVEYGKDNYCDFIDAANGSLVIILQDKHTGEYLPGGQFIVIRESDQVVIFDGSTDITGTIVVGNLLPGWYVVKQAYAPDGYTMIDVELKVEILVGTQQTLYFKDETAGLTIEKVDAKDPHQTLEGARFQVVRESDGNVMGEYVTDKSGLAMVNGLEPGRYTIHELVAPAGYIKMDEPKTVEVKGGANAHVTFPNMPRTSITVNVIDQATRIGVAGCIVEVWKQNGSLVNSYTSDSTGVIETQKLDNGFYVLKLIKVVDGYSATITEATVEVKDGEEVTYTFELISNGVLKVMSTNSAGSAIAGMKFTLTTYDGKRIGSFTTGANGTYTFASLAPGMYVVTEDKAPDGFNINTENKVQHIEVKAGGTATVTFVHAQTFGLQIRTTCQQTGAAVAGVKYQITQMTGEIVGVYTSDSAGIAFAPLTPGWYVVTAIEAPAGYVLVDTAPRNIQVLGDKLTTMDFVVSQQSSLRVKVVDGSTNAPIYNVHILLKNGTTNIQEYTTNNEGYITLNQTIVAGGYVLQMISAPSGYIIDTVPKSIDVMNAETTEIVWKLYKDAGQIQVYVTSSDYNENLDLPAGTPLQGAVFEIMNADTYVVVGQMISDTSGIAASAGLPIGRYMVKMITAPAYYAVNSSFNTEVRLKVNNDVVRVDTTVQSVFLDTSITQKTNLNVSAGSTMRVDILTADNISDSRLDDFFIHLKVPTDVARITTLEPGTWDGDIWYSISYKTNMQEYRVLAPDLLSSTKYTFDLSTQSLGLMPGEYVTDVRFEFGTVPTTFRVLEPTVYTLYVLSTAPTGYKLINDIEMGGRHGATSMSTNSNVNLSGNNNSALAGTGGQAVLSGASGQWVTDISSWSTNIIGGNLSSSLPKTGY